jgi:hypothetical protein
VAARFISSAAHTGNPTTSCAITIPTVLVGDLLVAYFTNGGATTAPTVTDDDGGTWNKKTSATVKGTLWWRRATSATSAKVVTAAGMTNSSSGTLFVIRGAVQTGDPFHQYSEEENIAGNETHAGITTTIPGCYIGFGIANGASNGDSAGVATVSGATIGAFANSRTATSTGGVDSANDQWGVAQAAAGATGAVTWAQADLATSSALYAITPVPEVSSWYVPASEPTRRKGLTAAVIAAGCFYGTFDTPPAPGPGTGLASTIGGLPPRVATLLYPSLQEPVPVVAGGGNKSLDADAGSYVVTGTTASLEYGRVASADAGSYAVTGSAAGLEYDRQVEAGAGSYAVTGTTASLEHGRQLVPDAGSYAVTGTTANLEHGRQLVPDAGSYAVTGTNASLEYGRKVNADAGSYAVTGSTASLEYSGAAGGPGTGLASVIGGVPPQFRSLLYPSLQEPVRVAPAAETVTVDKWFTPLAQPTRRKPIHALGSVTSVAPWLSAPVLTWTADTQDNTPDFDIEFDESADEGAVITLQIATDSGFTSIVVSYNDTLDAAEVLAGQVDLAATNLANGTYYARARVTDGGLDSPWSNTETVTIATLFTAAFQQPPQFPVRRTGFKTWQQQYLAFVGEPPAPGAIGLTADPGSYTVTGTTASLEYGRVVAAEIGSYTHTGVSASLERGFAVAADAGSYAVSGTDAALEYGREVVAGAGSYAVTGTDVTLNKGRTLDADGGSYAVTGTDASLEFGRLVAADAGSYAVTGTNASLVHEAVDDGRRYPIGSDRKHRRDGYGRAKITDEFLEELARLRKARDAAERAEEAVKTKKPAEVVRAARKAAKIVTRQAEAAADDTEWAAIAKAAKELSKGSTKQAAVVSQLVEILVVRIGEAEERLGQGAQSLEVELIESQRREQEILAAIIEEENAVIAILLSA